MSRDGYDRMFFEYDDFRDIRGGGVPGACLLYTSDAADE